MSPHIPLYLTPEQRSELETSIKSGNAPARVQTRARILLLADRSQGQFRTDKEIAHALLCSTATVANVRHRFLQEGLAAALVEKPGPVGPPRSPGTSKRRSPCLPVATRPKDRLAGRCVC
jgi:hypothetical protein